MADENDEIAAVQRWLKRAQVLPGQLFSLTRGTRGSKRWPQFLMTRLDDKTDDYLVPIAGYQGTSLEGAHHLLPESVPLSGRADRGQSEPAATACSGDVGC